MIDRAPIFTIRGTARPVEERQTWLVFSYFSNIDGMACSQHIDDRLPWLRRTGIKPVLISGMCGGKFPEYDHFRVPSLAPSGIRFELRHWFRKRAGNPIHFVLGRLLLLPVLLLYALEKGVVNLDSQWSWFAAAAWCGLSASRRQKIDVIYSTGGVPSAHLAAALVSRRTGLPWIAEMQDPLLYEPWHRGRLARRFYSRLEKLIAERADASVFLTGEARRRFAHRSETRGRCHVIYPGADPINMPRIHYVKREHCRIAHFGSLAGSRNLDSFLEALREMVAEDPRWQSVLHVELYGCIDTRARRAIEAFPFPSMIHHHGRVARQEAMRYMASTDVLLLVQNSDDFSAETIPSKFYEYLLAQRPLLALIHQNRELADLVRSRDGIAAEVTSVPEIKAGIFQAYELWQRGGAPPFRCGNPLTVEAAVEKLAALTEVNA